MTISQFSQWDGTTEANNVDLNDIPLVENQMYPRHVNNSFREMMKQLKAALGSAASIPFSAASASSAAYLDFHEDTDNGTNRARVIGPTSTADVVLTLPAATDTLVGKATTDVFTNKTFDANASGNVLSNVEVEDFAAAAIVTSGEGLASSDNDTSVPTSATIIDYVTGKQSFWIPAGAMVARASSGCGTSTYDSGASDVTILTCDFDTTTQEYAHFEFGMPKSWNESTVTAQFYWTNTGGASTETVRWSIAGRALGDDDAINGAMGTAVTVDDTWLAQNDLHISAETSAVTIGNTPAENDLVVFEITRVVASDNMAGDARLIGIKLHVTTSAANDA